MKMLNKNLTLITGIATGLLVGAYLLKDSTLIRKKKTRREKILSDVKKNVKDIKEKLIQAGEDGLDKSKAVVASMNNK